MIDIRDLMVGNCIHVKGLHGELNMTIRAITDKGTLSDENRVILFEEDKGQFGEFLKDCYPVVLSEEILLKCGFNYFESNNSYQLDTIFGFSFWGRINDGFNCYCQSEEFGTTINYLHELQNLYYFLTKQELEIKL